MKNILFKKVDSELVKIVWIGALVLFFILCAFYYSSLIDCLVYHDYCDCLMRTAVSGFILEDGIAHTLRITSYCVAFVCCFMCTFIDIFISRIVKYIKSKKLANQTSKKIISDNT